MWSCRVSAMSGTTSRTRPGWAILTGVGVAAIGLGLLLWLIGSFTTDVHVLVAMGNAALTIGVVGGVLAAAGITWRLLVGRQSP
jgi:hypothetical protein